MNESPPLTSDEQEITKQRIIHDAHLLVGGATIDAAGALRPTPEQIEALSHQAPSLNDTTSVEEQEAAVLANSEAAGMSSERLREIVGSSIYSVSFRQLHDSFGEQSLSYAGRGQFPTDYGGANLIATGNVKENKVNQYASHDFRDYVEQGAPELVTYTRGVTPSGELMGVSEPLSLVNYTTIRGAAGGNRYPYPEIPGDQQSRNVRLSYGLLLPDSEARELFSAMQADPEMARTTADEMITNPVANHSKLIGDISDWPKYRPPYGQWHDINTAANRPDRMVFNTVENRHILESQTVEF